MNEATLYCLQSARQRPSPVNAFVFGAWDVGFGVWNLEVGVLGVGCWGW